MDLLETLSGAFFDPLEQARKSVDADLEMAEIARILSVGNGVAQVAGFTDLHADELVSFPQGVLGNASNLKQDRIGVIVLGDTDKLRPGDAVRRTGRVVDVPVGAALLGRVVDGLGRPLDGNGPLDADERHPIERPAPPIMHRAPVHVPLQTGIKAIDAAIPIGRGQRELILGDRQTGKTAIAVDAILNQRDTGVVSIYCAIGQRASAVARVISDLRKGGALERTIVVVAGGNDAPGLQFVAPYAATTMAEYFMAEGKDVLIVYDDLTRHARAYRELSLLLRRPPGREAYPGDIFYIHSRMLERATRLRDEYGGGSLTALPIVETQAQNISAYIPTNLISITDGQVYLSPDLFEKGQLPAIDVGTSVSRVGGKVQLPAFRAVAGNLRLMYAQFEELESFARFGTQLDDETRSRLTRGQRVREVLRQREHQHLNVPQQIAALLAATEGLFDKITPDEIGAAERTVQVAVQAGLPDLCTRITEGEKMEPEDRDALIQTMRRALRPEEDEVETETLESLSEALGTTKDIQSIVRTMKSLSAVSIRQFERAEEALADYARTIDLGLLAVLGERRAQGIGHPARPAYATGRDALIVIGSDRGLCGRYNEVVSRCAIDQLSGADAMVGVIGVRAAVRIEAAGHQADALFTVPGSVDGFTNIVQSVIIAIDRWTAEQDVTRVRVIHNHRVGQSTAQPLVRQLLPIPEDDLERAAASRWPARGLPIFRMDRDVLLSWLIRERLFLLLYRSLAEALASEHATRLTAMQNAERNIDERRDELSAAFRQKRQESITRELLDVVAGYEAAGTVE